MSDYKFSSLSYVYNPFIKIVKVTIIKINFKESNIFLKNLRISHHKVKK